MLPIAGTLSIVAMAVFRMRKSKGQPKPVDVQEVQGLQDFASPKFDAAVASRPMASNAPGLSVDQLNLT